MREIARFARLCLLACFGAALLAFACGCNVVALQQALTSLYASYRDERVALLDALLDNMDRLEARPTTLRARTMVVWGRQDPVFPLEIGERLAASLHAPLRVLEHARHAPNLEHAAEFNRILRGFLASGG